MAVYDPLRPQVIGGQWSPVRQESIPLDLSTEIGYTFSVTGGTSSITSPQEAFWSASHVPTTLVQGQTPFISIYRRGQEANVGRVYRFVIPAASVQVTGATVSDGGTATQAVSYPFDDRHLVLPAGNSQIVAFFNLGANEDAILQNRRILKVNLLYTASGPFNEFDNETNGVFSSIETNTVVWSMGLGSVTGPLSERDNTSVSRVNLGDVNPFWNAGVSPFTYSDRYPWRWEELNRFDSAEPVATRLSIGIHGSNLPTTTDSVKIGYMALEVVVCEENRLWYGGNAMGRLSTSANAFDLYEIANTINLRTTSFQTTGSLEPGDYSVTITLADAGDTYNRGDRPHVASLREAEPLSNPGPQGVLITKWQDPDGISEVQNNSVIEAAQYFFAGNPPTVSSSRILPGIGISNTDDVELDRTAPHSYCVQIQADVLDSTVAQQNIVNNANTVGVRYPWVRFYARRFGDLSRTLRIRALTGIPAQATIDQATFDALPEIINGWREVTLRFDAATPSFSNDGSLSTWQWETINGSVNDENKWEILGAYTDSIGTSSVTYGIVPNASATFHNISDPATSEAQNTFTDLMLMFSQDPVAVSGLAIETLSQEVTGIGLECSSLPECVPTGIAYHHVTWSSGAIVCDTFSREVTGGWDGTDTGQTYTTTGGSASDYAVTDGTGTLTFTSGTGSRRTTLSGLSQTDPDLYAQFSIDQTPTGAALTLGFTARGTDTNNQYVLSARCNTDGTILALIERVIAGSFVNIGSGTVPDVQFFPDQVYNMRARLEGTSLRLRIWEEGADEPTIWHATATDATYMTGTVSGFRANVAAGYTGSYPVVFSVDNFATSEVTTAGNTYELQRKDAADDTWHTIMRSGDLCPTSFNDYEARVGVQSTYRIRLVNALRFPGPWSSEVSSTLTSPGVFGAGDGNSILIFTSNEAQSGSLNLAHSMSWDRNPEEEFNFPEAGTVQLQSMYQRDFAIAFHSTERGGEQFSRTLLVNNAVVSTQRIRDGFRSLRDMAWEDVSYVCVRNELGDRWFAAVLVPNGSVQRNRRLYLAQVDIVEVTDTPSEVTISEFLGQ